MSRQKDTLYYRIQDNQAVLCVVIDGVDTVMLTLDEHPTDTGLQRNLMNEHHPLNRVLALNQKMTFWCIPHDQHLTRTYFKNVAKVTPDDSCPCPCPCQTVANENYFNQTESNG